MGFWKHLSKAKDEASTLLTTLMKASQNSPVHKMGRKLQVLKPIFMKVKDKWDSVTFPLFGFGYCSV